MKCGVRLAQKVSLFTLNTEEALKNLDTNPSGAGIALPAVTHRITGCNCVSWAVQHGTEELRACRPENAFIAWGIQLTPHR